MSDREEQVSKDESLHFSLAGFLIPATGNDTRGKEKEMMEKRKRERGGGERGGEILIDSRESMKCK